MGEMAPAAQPSEMAAQPTEAVATSQPQTESKRTQLKAVRENIQWLSRDVGTFKKSSETSARRGPVEGRVS